MKISEFYLSTKYFSFMPPVVFEALERAFLNGEETALVSNSVYKEMISAYEKAKVCK